MQNVYESVSANKTKSMLIMAGFVAFITTAVYAISYYANLGSFSVFVALGSSVGMSLVSYFAGDKIALSLNGAKEATRKEYFNYYTVVQNLSLAAGIPMPKLYVIPDSGLNAFATGRDPQHASIAATEGILNTLDRTELEGVIGHEISHILNYDTRLMTIVSILIGVLSSLVNLAYWNSGRFSRRRDNNEKGDMGSILMIFGLISIIIGPLLAQLIQLAISRQREFLADANSVKLTRQPSGLISALEKISAHPQFSQANQATRTMYIASPFGSLGKLAGLFSTHPPVEDRIKALEAMM